MSWLHLIWIVPVAWTIGVVTTVFCIESKMDDEEIEREALEWQNRRT